MDDMAVARALHVLAVVWWIGGVAMVTTVILPHARRLRRGTAEFEQMERRFALQARVATLLAGISGFYMIVRFDLAQRFHWFMLALSVITILGAVAGSHGGTVARQRTIPA